MVVWKLNCKFALLNSVVLHGSFCCCCLEYYLSCFCTLKFNRNNPILIQFCTFQLGTNSSSCEISSRRWLSKQPVSKLPRRQGHRRRTPLPRGQQGTNKTRRATQLEAQKLPAEVHRVLAQLHDQGWLDQFTKKNANSIWFNSQFQKVMQDFQASVLQVSDTLYDEEIIKTMPMIHYEFPNGFHKDFGVERFKIPEPLFNPTTGAKAGIQPILGVGPLVTTSVGMCDIDVRPVWSLSAFLFRIY